MSVTLHKCRVTILVKALPQPSKTHGETVCCAGVTVHGEWKRLFPVRYRIVVREEKLAGKGKLKVKMVLTGEGTGLRHKVEGEIDLADAHDT